MRIHIYHILTSPTCSQGQIEQKTYQTNKNDDAFQFKETDRLQIKVLPTLAFVGSRGEGFFCVYYYITHQSTGYTCMYTCLLQKLFDALVLNLTYSGEKTKEIKGKCMTEKMTNKSIHSNQKPRHGAQENALANP